MSKTVHSRGFVLALIALLALAVFSAAPVTAQAPRSGGAPLIAANDNAIRDHYIVVLRDGADPRAVAAVVQAQPRFVYAAALTGFAAQLNAGQLTALQHNRNVAYIEQDQVVSIDTTITAATMQEGATWGLDRIDQRALPLSGTYSYNNSGAGVTAYIIDTGIDFSHTEFGIRAIPGFDAFTDGQNGNDCNGHGTHVAGTVGGTTYGVAKGVTLVAVRVLDCGGSGSWSGVVAGVDWVVAHHAAGSPAVSNMSLGGGVSSTVDAAVDRMITDGVASAVAAGNGNQVGVAQDACRYSPARVARAMTIGATTRTDAKTSWSNYGKCVDWFAPGAGITSAWIGGGNAEKNTISGTSMATPHTAGVAALYLQSNSSATPQQVRDALYAATTQRIVTSSKTANNHLLFTSY